MYHKLYSFSWLSTVLLTVPMLCSSVTNAYAQALPSSQPDTVAPGNAPPCQPPAPAEYLLLVVTRTQESQAQVQQLLPPNTAIAGCTYLNDSVTRVGGFRTADRANAWARYITESTGLAAFVARPAESPPMATTPGSPAPTATKKPPQVTTKPSTVNPSSYNPKVLGPGYAVLVDYGNQPETAAKVQQTLGKEVGLASYRQRPFLLAIYTVDANTASTMLQTLSDRGFLAALVDSRQVILLRQPIRLPR